MDKQTCVITGATGLVGSALIPALVPRFEVHGVSRRLQPNRDVNWHQLDLAAPCDLDRLPRRVDAVVYLAQSELFRSFPDHCLDVHQVNTGNLVRFLDYARKVGARHFVFASSGGVYGGGDSRLSEEREISMHGDLGFYLGTKVCSEILARSFSELFSVVILRFFFVYGPGQRSTMLIPRLIARVRAGEPILLQGEHGIRINPTHVSDAVAATVRALDLQGSHTVNVGGPDVLTLREIGDIIGQAVGKTPAFRVNEQTPPRNLCGDISKMRELLVPPRVSFSEGLQSML